MNQIVKEPVIKNFLSYIPQKQHPAALKQLIMIGVNMVSGSMQGTNRFKYPQNQQNQSFMDNLQHQNRNNNQVLHELNHIRNRINQLADLVSNSDTIKQQQKINDLSEIRPAKENKQYKSKINKNTQNAIDSQPLVPININHMLPQTNYFMVPTKDQAPLSNRFEQHYRQQPALQRNRGLNRPIIRRALNDDQIKLAMTFPESPPNCRPKLKSKNKQLVTANYFNQVKNAFNFDNFNTAQIMAPQSRMQTIQPRRAVSPPANMSTSPYSQQQKLQKSRKINNQNSSANYAKFNRSRRRITEYDNQLRRSRKMNSEINKRSIVRHNTYQQNQANAGGINYYPEIRSKIKSLVDKDKFKFQYENQNKPQKQLKVQIYEGPSKRQYLDDRRYEYSNEEHEFQQTNNFEPQQEEDYSSYRMQQENHQDQSKFRRMNLQNLPQRQTILQKPRQSELQEITFKKNKNNRLQLNARENSKPSEQKNKQSSKKISPGNKYDVQDFKDQYEGQSESSSFSQFSLGSSGRREVGKISRRNQK